MNSFGQPWRDTEIEEGSGTKVLTGSSGNLGLCLLCFTFDWKLKRYNCSFTLQNKNKYIKNQLVLKLQGFLKKEGIEFLFVTVKYSASGS